jgi:hypothetical protein
LARGSSAETFRASRARGLRHGFAYLPRQSRVIPAPRLSRRCARVFRQFVALLQHPGGRGGIGSVAPRCVQLVAQCRQHRVDARHGIRIARIEGECREVVTGRVVEGRRKQMAVGAQRIGGGDQSLHAVGKRGSRARRQWQRGRGLHGGRR